MKTKRNPVQKYDKKKWRRLKVGEKIKLIDFAISKDWLVLDESKMVTGYEGEVYKEMCCYYYRLRK